MASTVIPPGDNSEPREISEFFTEVSDRDANFTRLVEAIGEQAQLNPIISTAQNELVQRLKPFGVSARAIGGVAGGGEVLSSADGRCAVLARRRRGRAGRDGQVFEFLTISTGAPLDLQGILKERLGSQVREGTYHDHMTARALRSRIGELSPNGKKLSHEVARESIRHLYDDELRSSLGFVVDVFGDSPITRDYLGSLRGGSQALLPANGDPPESVFDRRFLVTCGTCEERHFVFDTDADAQASMQEGKAKCASCGGADFATEEAFAVPHAVPRRVTPRSLA